MNINEISARKRFELKLTELSHYIKKSLGQNFLVSDHVIQKIINAVSEELPESLIENLSEKLIEIGPGLGAITDLLILKYGRYKLIELDKSLVDYWKSQNMPVIEGDALQINWKEINFDVLVSNLPYQISSSIVIDRSLDVHQCRSMILMFQKEVAQRIRAKAKTEEYGMLSVIAQEFWDIQTVCEAGPSDFNPPPKVASRVLKFKYKESNIDQKNKYFQFVKMCFKQRRRILKSNLEKKYHDKYLKWIAQNNLSDKVRVEELSPTAIKELYFYLKESL